MGPTEHREVEVTLEAPEGWSPPPAPVLLAAVARAGATAVDDAVEHHLDARYLDTPDLRLLRARTTLRRRSGGDDAGWHLKLPADGEGARTEVHLPLRRGPQGAPRQLSSLVLATTRGERLVPVAHLVTTRRVHRVLGTIDAGPLDAGPAGAGPIEAGAAGAEEAGAGRVVVLAEIADDEVVADVLPEQPGPDAALVQVRWREVEVELVEGGPKLLTALVDALVASGARRSDQPSKLRRALADRLGALPPAPPPPPPPKPRSSAADVLRAHVHAQRAALLSADPRVRRGSAEAVGEAVHQMRVATRRLRSALATTRPLLADHDAVASLREELAWLAGELGHARDAQVVQARLAALVGTQPAGLLPAQAAERLAARAAGAVDEGLAAARSALESPRYLQLLAALDALATSPPLTGRAAEPAARVLRSRARHDHRRLVEAVDAADGARDAAAHEVALHEVRKAAKRARYGAEVLVPVLGKDARRYARAVAAVQEVLGQVQDSLVLRALLREVAAQAVAAGEDAFGYGRLHALQEVRAAAAEAEFEHVWHEVARPRARRWMR